LAKRPKLLELALERRPVAVMLSFGDPAPFVEQIKRGGAKLICQVQTVAMACDAQRKALMYSSPKGLKPGVMDSAAGRWRWYRLSLMRLDRTFR
jgi:hypothetical protein